jgi:hypothetical protein
MGLVKELIELINYFLLQSLSAMSLGVFLHVGDSRLHGSIPLLSTNNNTCPLSLTNLMLPSFKDLPSVYLLRASISSNTLIT